MRFIRPKRAPPWFESSAGNRGSDLIHLYTYPHFYRWSGYANLRSTLKTSLSDTRNSTKAMNNIGNTVGVTTCRQRETGHCRRARRLCQGRPMRPNHRDHNVLQDAQPTNRCLLIGLAAADNSVCTRRSASRPPRNPLPDRRFGNLLLRPKWSILTPGRKNPKNFSGTRKRAPTPDEPYFNPAHPSFG